MGKNEEAKKKEIKEEPKIEKSNDEEIKVTGVKSEKGEPVEEQPVIEKKTSFFYLGPTLKRGVLEKGAVFRGELPEEVKELKKKIPLVAALIVEKKDYIKSCKDMKTKGSRLQLIHKKLLEGGK